MAGPVRHNEKRTFQRYPIKLLIEIMGEEEKSSVVTETQDLSQSGVSFYTDWKLPLNCNIQIKFLFGGKSFRVKAIVINSIEDPKIWRFYTTVVFLDTDENIFVRLAQQFIELIEEDSSSPAKTKFRICETEEKAPPPSFWSRFFKS